MYICMCLYAYMYRYIICSMFIGVYNDVHLCTMYTYVYIHIHNTFMNKDICIYTYMHMHKRICNMRQKLS